VFCFSSPACKRKLNVAVAMMGNPRLLLLDDPTRGMDPESRMCTCELLQKYTAGGGTIVMISTRYDEAPVQPTRGSLVYP